MLYVVRRGVLYVGVCVPCPSNARPVGVRGTRRGVGSRELLICNRTCLSVTSPGRAACSLYHSVRMRPIIGVFRFTFGIHFPVNVNVGFLKSGARKLHLRRDALRRR